jgi:hypothetical protein
MEMTPPTLALIDFLTWVERRPRTYAETIEAWRGNCPRLAVWDDAVSDGLVRVERNGDGLAVTLTEAGRAARNGTA